MPLTRATVTAASRIMLPTYPILASIIGAAYLFGAPTRTSSPAFDVAKQFMSIQSWGVVFLAMAAMLIVGYLIHSRDVTVFVLFMAASAFVMWAVFFGISVLQSHDASLVAPAWPSFAACACSASAISVAKREGDPDRGVE